MIQLEFVSTECLRPEICSRAWQSFHKNLTEVDWEHSTLYLHMDKLPKEAGEKEANQMLTEASKVFGHVLGHVGQEPNFTNAVKWGWNQPLGPVFFYLQADWILLEKVDAEFLLLSLFQMDLDSLNLRAYKGSYERLCLSPVLIRSHVAKSLVKKMNNETGPEAQLRVPSKRKGGRSLGVDLKSSCWPRGRKVVKDIGREWARKNNVRKKGGSDFVTWE